MNLCAKCASYSKTCCIERDILVTQEDVQRISLFIGDSGFFEYRVPQDLSYLQQDDDPIWSRSTIQPDGSRRVLKQQQSQRCIFVGDNGCILPCEMRPLVCRLHPASYTERGIDGFVDECPAYLLENQQTIMDGIGLNPVQLESWRSQLYDELTHEKALQSF